MRQVSIRYLIGLGDPSDPTGLDPATRDKRAAARRTLAELILGGAYDCVGIYQGAGFWKGTAEPCMMVEAIREDSESERAKAREHADYLRRSLGQDAIGLVFAPVDFELI